MSLKQKLQNNQLTIGTWLTIGHQSIVEVLATANFEWIVVDLEHSAMDISIAQQMIGHIQAKGLKALVRVSKNEEVIIKRVLDAGADGVIIPMVKNKVEALQAIDYVKYPPIGKRGVGLARAQNYGIGFEAYQEKLEKEIVIIVQIEHIEAVNNIDSIIGTEGIDGMIIGPYDLSGSMGKPGKFEDADVIEALEKVKSTCKSMNFPLGIHIINPDAKELNKRKEEGYTFIAFSLDFLFLGNKAREEMNISTSSI